MASEAKKHKKVDIGKIPESTHLFFDDEPDNVEQVARCAAEYNKEHPDTPIQLEAILCPSGHLTLVAGNGGEIKVTSVAEYKKHKINRSVFHNANVCETFETFKDKGVGSGLTQDIIEQIIHFEMTHKGNTRLYFFDFDKLLSQLGSFSFFVDLHDTEGHLPEYAKFLFSDHIEEETASTGGRLSRLREMFSLIGPERLYIMTFNAAARKSSKDHNVILTRRYFMEILQQLLPDINPEHVKLCMTPGPTPAKTPQQNKGKFIVELIEHYRPKADSPKKSPRASASSSVHSPKKSPRAGAGASVDSPKGSSTTRSRYGLKGGTRKSKITRRRKYRK